MQALKLSCRHAGERSLVWEGVAAAPARDFCYRYAVVGEDGELAKWHALPQAVALPPWSGGGELVLDLSDEWVDRSHPAELLKWRPFQSVLGPAPPLTTLHRAAVPPGATVLRFQIWRAGIGCCLRRRMVVLCGDRELEEGEALCLTGGAPQLGSWQLHEALPMAQTAPCCWEAEVALPLPSLAADVLTYKYAIQAADGNLTLEHGESRLLSVPEVAGGGGGGGAPPAAPGAGGGGGAPPGCGPAGGPEDGVREPAAAGVTVRLQNDGYFRRRGQGRTVAATAATVDEAERRWRGAGVAVPVFSLRTKDSTGCGEFLDLINDGPTRNGAGAGDPDIAARIRAAKRELDLEAVEYEGTMRAKLGVARAAFDRLGRAATSGAEFQFHLHTQLMAARSYAERHGVVLKGDLPIGVAKCSVETWMYPNLFRMGVSIGAPPDQFDPKASPPPPPPPHPPTPSRFWYFQVLRVDHILGFFRIWEIPRECSMGLLGRFRPSAPIQRSELESRGIWDVDRLCDPHVTPAVLTDRRAGRAGGGREACWRFGRAMAADLARRYFEPGAGGRLRFRPELASEKAILGLEPPPGSTPADVEEADFVTAELLSLRQNVVLLRDPADPAAFYPVVASPSSHDTSTTRAWYQEDPLRRQRFWAGALGNEGATPPECTPEVMRQVVQQHLDSPAVLAIFPIQDIHALSPDFATRPPEEEQAGGGAAAPPLLPSLPPSLAPALPSLRARTCPLHPKPPRAAHPATMPPLNTTPA
eukprot:scaffold17.g572.t1